MADGLFPHVEPSASGWLDVTGGHALYYEVCGNPRGIPAVFLHGGPGSSINAGHRRFFDPQRYRVVLFDQRGCGRSKPRGTTDDNSTQDSVGDIERLREHFGIERWLLFGGSWGSTLAIAYAAQHADRVSGCVLRGVFLGTDAEVEWFIFGLRRFAPAAWEEFAQGAPLADASAFLQHYYARVQAGGSDALEAARRWTAWENALMAIGESGGGGGNDASAALDRVRVQLHFLVAHCFLEPAQLLHAATRLAQVPCMIVQGRRDLICPPHTAYALAQAWPQSQLSMIEDAGHNAMHPSMSSALVRALADLPLRLQRA